MSKPAPDVQRIFDKALDIDSSEERARFLAEACGSDAAMRDEIASLLVAFDSAGNFLENALVASTELEGPGSVIGSYKLLEKIGEGGMGAVYMAEQSQPIRRKVALKIIKPGMDSRQVIARFEAERQALAILDHPNIAKVFEAGTTASGRPYFVMELVKGLAITAYCDEAQLTPGERLELLVSVCQATHHAHQKGIIHRDIKPSNVLVSLYDGTPVPKMIDFGVAKAIDQRLTESTLYTQHGAIVGTLEYMSPEQAENSAIDVDTRTDVYALGVLLFELMTGTTPLEHERLKQAGYSEVLRRLREEEPPSLSSRLSKNAALAVIAARRNTEPAKLTRLVRGELDWIAMKALSKDRTRRYETANDLARDLQRFLVGQPVEAAPPSASYRIGKYASKHRAVLSTAATILVVMAVATAISSWQAVRARREEANAKAVLKFFSETVLGAARPKDQQGGKGVDLTVRAAMDAAEPAVGRQFAGQPLVEAAIRDTIGTTYIYVSEPKRAIAQHARALALRATVLGEDHPETLASMNNLAVAYRLAGRLDEAVALHEKQLGLAQSRLGLDDLDTLMSMNNLALAYRMAGRNDRAIALFEHVLARRTAKLGRDDPETLITLHNLAVAYRSAFRFAEAVSLHEEELERSKKALPADHPDTLTAMDSLATAYLYVGELEAALPLFEESLKLRSAKLGANHSDTLTSKSDLAAAHQLSGRISEAVREFEEVLKQRQADPGLDHPETLRSMNNLALALREAGRSNEAVSMLEDVLDRRKAKLGVDHRDTLKTMNDLAGLYLESRRWSQAEPLLEACLKLRESKQSADWRLFQTMSQLGEAMAGQNKQSDAEPMLIHGYEGLKARESNIPYFKRNEISAAIARLVAFYERRHEPQKALEWRQKMPPSGTAATRTFLQEPAPPGGAGRALANCLALTSGTRGR
jgi:eukaryotic-like serine/threonine-protein kinase